MIIHISGSPGSGKSTLGDKFKKYFKKKVVVQDLDALYGTFANQNSDEDYQGYINNFIEKNSKKSIIFVGLNNDTRSGTLYDLNSDYNFFIDLPIEINVKRHFMRQMDDWLDFYKSDLSLLFDRLIDNEKKTIKEEVSSLEHALSLKEKKKYLLSFYKIYKKEGYIFMTPDEIYKKVLEIL